MKPFTVSFILLFSITCTVFSQNISHSIGLDYSKKNLTGYFFKIDSTTNLIELNNIETGSKKSFELHYAIKYLNLYEYGIGVKRYPHYGMIYTLNNKIFISPFIFKSKHSRVDIYIPISIECYYTNNTYVPQKRNIYIESANFGIGSSVNLLKKLSVQIELRKEFSSTYNVFIKPYLQFGISYNWGKNKDD